MIPCGEMTKTEGSGATQRICRCLTPNESDSKPIHWATKGSLAYVDLIAKDLPVGLGLIPDPQWSSMENRPNQQANKRARNPLVFRVTPNESDSNSRSIGSSTSLFMCEWDISHNQNLVRIKTLYPNQCKELRRRKTATDSGWDFPLLTSTCPGLDCGSYEFQPTSLFIRGWRPLIPRTKPREKHPPNKYTLINMVSTLPKQKTRLGCFLAGAQ